MVSDYTVDSYGHLAASAVSAYPVLMMSSKGLPQITGQSFMREGMSASLVIVGSNFYNDLGPQVASSILAAIATALAVLPFLFWRFGPTIRARSAYYQQVCCVSLSVVLQVFRCFTDPTS